MLNTVCKWQCSLGS